ncbi:MAG: SusC/RagA family TonB-linked outer membrane protein [Chitinophagaceae bacterium]|nr:MAG: SusC/RagA family TonB-linked outer membrane protein [Chitinophagaceae bacterium]
MKKFQLCRDLFANCKGGGKFILMITIIVPAFILPIPGSLMALGNSNNMFLKNYSFTRLRIIPNNVEDTTITVHGRVTNVEGTPLFDVSIHLNGTAIGTSSDQEGKYQVTVPRGGLLVFSFIGYETQAVKIGQQSMLNIELKKNEKQLGEVVVTALGVKENSSQITYATQTIAGKALTTAPSTNFVDMLTGQVSGVNIHQNASGIGGSANIVIRGFKSVQGSNQPLIVVDGIPITNFSSDVINQTFTSMDQGDVLSTLNPQDIASITVLKGASAAALYGSEAANGAILITTKQGKAGSTEVHLSTGLTIDKAAYGIPKLQNSYGETAPGSEESWGSPISNAQNIISGFFQNGITNNNSISFSSGNEKSQTYVSYGNTSARGIIQRNNLSRNTLNVNQTSHYFNNKLSISANLSMMKQTMDNPVVSGYQATVLRGLYGFPRGLDFTPYKNYEIFDSVRNVYTQHWPFITADDQNPYWVANKNVTQNSQDRSMVSLTAKYLITDWLNIQLRGSREKVSDLNTIDYYLGTQEAYGGSNGGYQYLNETNTQYYGDALLNFMKTFNKFRVNALIGTSIKNTETYGVAAGNSTTLYIPNVFLLQNMSVANGVTVSQLSNQHEQLQSVFGSANLSYNEWLYLNVTGRNDWASTLSFTPNVSFFYPSIGLGLILNQALKLPTVISYAKLRGSYAVVGNAVPLYVTNPQNHINSQGNVRFNNTAPFTDLKPEKTRSIELGAEVRLFEDQFSLDFTYYKSNSINQFFPIAVPPGTGFSTRFVNAGNIQNSGVEINVGYSTPIGNPFQWKSNINFTLNRNVVKSLASSLGIKQFVLINDINDYSSILTIGGSYGDIYGTALEKDPKTGKLMIDTSGVPIRASGLSFLGNPNPKFQMGWSNDFSYKNFTLRISFDGQDGGKAMDLTEQMLDQLGVSKASGVARERGGVKVNGIVAETGAPINTVSAYNWYQTIGGRGGVTGEYMYDLTNIRLREISIGYLLPKRMLTGNFIKNIELSLVARNIAFLYNKAPFDPDLIYASQNGYNGVMIFNQPSTRNLGFTLNVTF